MAAVCVFCASSHPRSPLARPELAAEVGTELAARGHTLVTGGGCVGMMGAVAAAPGPAAAHTVGVIPQALVDLEVADHDADELLVTDDMRHRKDVMDERSDAFLTLPGGLGTLDELFEVWAAGRSACTPSRSCCSTRTASSTPLRAPGRTCWSSAASSARSARSSAVTGRRPSARRLRRALETGRLADHPTPVARVDASAAHE